MTDLQLHKEIDALPTEFKEELVQIVRSFRRVADILQKKEPQLRKAGTLKGMFGELPDDFDEPLEDFKDYM